MRRRAKKSKKSRSKRPSPSINSNFFHPTSLKDVDEKIYVDTFRVYGGYTSSTTGGTATVNETDLVPSQWGTRGVAMADLFRRYRITGIDIEFHFHPGFVNTATQAMYMPGNVSWFAAISYTSISTFTAPTTASHMVDFPHVAWSQDNSARIMRINLTRSDLKQHQTFNWYNTATTGSGANEYTQLALEVLSQPVANLTTASVLDMIINLRVEFTESVDPALIPSLMKSRYYEKWKEEEVKELKDCKDFIVLPSSSGATSVVPESSSVTRNSFTRFTEVRR
jgi:hypothetical protein